MILLYFIEINILNNYDNLEKCKSFNINIKKMIITIGFTIIMYLLLHQVNQNNTSFKFELYNKLLILMMLIDFVISLFFLSKFIIADIINNVS